MHQNETISLKLVKCNSDMYRSWSCSMAIKDLLIATFFQSVHKAFNLKQKGVLWGDIMPKCYSSQEQSSNSRVYLAFIYDDTTTDIESLF